MHEGGGEERRHSPLHCTCAGGWRCIYVLLSQAVVLDCIACLKTGSLQLWPFSPALLPFMSCVSLLPPSPIPTLSPLLCPSPPSFSALPKVFHRSIRNFMVCTFVAVQETHIRSFMSDVTVFLILDTRRRPHWYWQGRGLSVGRTLQGRVQAQPHPPRPWHPQYGQQWAKHKQITVVSRHGHVTVM